MSSSWMATRIGTLQGARRRPDRRGETQEGATPSPDLQTGALPQTPGFCAFWPIPRSKDSGRLAPPASRSWTWIGARVASQQCPILRPGTVILAAGHVGINGSLPSSMGWVHLNRTERPVFPAPTHRLCWSDLTSISQAVLGASKWVPLNRTEVGPFARSLTRRSHSRIIAIGAFRGRRNLPIVRLVAAA